MIELSRDMFPETMNIFKESKRILIPEYAMRLAEVVAMRSEDPYTKVGAVALTQDNRIIATAYNGLPATYQASHGFWNNREKRLKFMIHAEQNLCALIKRNEADKIAITLLPCSSCLALLVAHGIKQIWYKDLYHRDDSALEIADLYKVRIIQIDENYNEKLRSV